ncbi:MAG: Fe-S cluster assembly protein SufB [Patescibacteria group bacterium]
MLNKPPNTFRYRYGFSMPEKNVYSTGVGLSDKVIRDISRLKNEPSWMLDYRLQAYAFFCSKKIPDWGVNLKNLDLDRITYFIRATQNQTSSWEDLPKEIKQTYDRIGVPEAERKFLAGVSAQYESEVVYESMQKELKKKGVVFCDMDSGLRQYPEIVKAYFATLVPFSDNKFAALNSSVWSGGSFVYIPKGVHVNMPLQAYFRMNAPAFGQFERTLIIADEGSFVHYIEGCTAPVYTKDSLHSAVVEIFVQKNARVRYTTVQNWSKNVFNLVTKRAQVQEKGIMEWIDCNLGSKATMKYPAIYLKGKSAHGEVLSIAYSGKNQHQDAGAKIFHIAPHTSSRIVSKSISKSGGRCTYRGSVSIARGAEGSSAFVTCDALLLDGKSRSDTYPRMRIREKQARIHHEATTSKIKDQELLYLQQRGIKKIDAEGLYINGFIEPIVKEIPLEYSIELNRLLQVEMSHHGG